MAKGTAVHTHILEHAKFKEQYLIAPKMDRRTKEGRVAWQELEVKAAAHGKRLLPAADAADVVEMHASLMAHPMIRTMLEHPDAIFEQSVFWKDEETGLRCKCRPDICIPSLRIVADLKTAKDASPKGFARAISNLGYDQGQSYYVDGCTAEGTRIDDYCFVAVETAPPFACALHRIGADWEDAGRTKYREALRIVQDCIKNNFWPAYGQEVTTLETPRWLKEM